MPEYTLAPSRFVKDKVAVCAPSPEGPKTRAARLACSMSGGRYTHRERSYIMSAKAAQDFELLYGQGWDACPLTGNLKPPNEGMYHV